MLRLIEGFEHCGPSTATMAQIASRLATKWDVIGSCSSGTYSLVTGYYDWGLGLKAHATDKTNGMSKNFDNQGTWIIGFAFKTPTTHTTTDDILTIWQQGGGECAILQFNSDETLRVYTAGTLRYTSSALSLNTWYYIEFKVVIHNTAGSWELVLNGTSLSSGSGVDTSASGAAYANAIGFYLTGGNIFDDIYILDGQAGLNTFRGRSKVFSYFPNSDGGVNEWIASPSGDHYAVVDETPLDLNDYLETDVNGDRDLFGFEATSGTGLIYGVQLVGQFFTEGTGPKTASIVCLSNATEATAEQIITQPDNHIDIVLPIELNPDTASAWTNSTLNAAKFGVEKVS